MTPLHAKYLDNLQEAKDFEDFAFDVMLRERRLVIGGYKSRHFQTMYGESDTGVEVKLDRKFRETGNLFIETAERHHEAAEMKPSGIYHETNPWMLLIGDYEQIWAFGTIDLRREHQSRKFRETETATSRGYLLPVAVSHLISLFTWPRRSDDGR